MADTFGRCARLRRRSCTRAHCPKQGQRADTKKARSCSVSAHSIAPSPAAGQGSSFWQGSSEMHNRWSHERETHFWMITQVQNQSSQLTPAAPLRTNPHHSHTQPGRQTQLPRRRYKDLEASPLRNAGADPSDYGWWVTESHSSWIRRTRPCVTHHHLSPRPPQVKYPNHLRRAPRLLAYKLAWP